MARAVIGVNSIEFDGKLINTCTIEESFGPNAKREQFPLNCQASDPEFVKLRASPPQVKGAGERLYKALTAKPAGATLFAQWLVEPPPGPIFFQVDSPDVEELPWETLYDTQFRALNGQYPIARLASSSSSRKPIERVIGTRLRIAVILAAAGVSGMEEWNNIAGVIAALTIPLDLLALVSEDAVHAGISAAAAQWRGQGLPHVVQVEYVGDAESLVRRACAHMPNIVHFFCHGVVDVRPLLELENRADRRGKRERGGISLDLELLKPLVTVESLWLVVLNCCQGAKRAPQLHSLARDLVARGIPAVVAMRESVDVNDANVFAQHFYQDVLARLTGIFALRNGPAVLQKITMPELLCVHAVDTARRRLAKQPRQPDTSVEWTFPVIYLHRDELVLHVREIAVSRLSESERLALVTQLGVLLDMQGAIHPTGAEELAAAQQLAANIADIQSRLSGATPAEERQ